MGERGVGRAWFGGSWRLTEPERGRQKERERDRLWDREKTKRGRDPHTHTQIHIV